MEKWRRERGRGGVESALTFSPIVQDKGLEKAALSVTQQKESKNVAWNPTIDSSAILRI